MRNPAASLMLAEEVAPTVLPHTVWALRMLIRSSLTSFLSDSSIHIGLLLQTLTLIFHGRIEMKSLLISLTSTEKSTRQWLALIARLSFEQQRGNLGKCLGFLKLRSIA